MEHTKESIDWWIERAGLSEYISVFMSAIEIDWVNINKDELPNVNGIKKAYNDVGYRVLARLLEAAKELSDG